MIKLYSFDIFDTLITRETATPVGVFALMQKELSQEKYSYIDSHIKDNFFIFRTQVEKFLRAEKSYSGIEEITLDEIYSKISCNYNIDNKIADELKELEIKTEINVSVPINENIDKIKQLCNSNERVILISDMYLSEEIIRKILITHDDVFKSIPIYLSSYILFSYQ